MLPGRSNMFLRSGTSSSYAVRFCARRAQKRTAAKLEGTMLPQAENASYAATACGV
jgi:hypothetical protein